VANHQTAPGFLHGREKNKLIAMISLIGCLNFSEKCLLPLAAKQPAKRRWQIPLTPFLKGESTAKQRGEKNKYKLYFFKQKYIHMKRDRN
jgi:hypothetical protein